MRTPVPLFNVEGVGAAGMLCFDVTSPFSTLKSGDKAANNTRPRAFILPLPVSKNRSYIVLGRVSALVLRSVPSRPRGKILHGNLLPAGGVRHDISAPAGMAGREGDVCAMRRRLLLNHRTKQPNEPPNQPSNPPTDPSNRQSHQTNQPRYLMLQLTNSIAERMKTM